MVNLFPLNCRIAKFLYEDKFLAAIFFFFYEFWYAINKQLKCLILFDQFLFAVGTETIQIFSLQESILFLSVSSSSS